MITRPRNLPQADPYFDSVVLLAPFSGEDGDTTSTDLSNEAHTMTFNANSVLDGDIRKFGFTSAKFDGTGDYVSIPDALSLSPVSSSFTVECDVRFNGDPTTDQHTFVGKWTGTGLQKEWWVGYRNNKLNAFLSSNGSNGIFLADVVWDPAGDTWYHIAFVFDRELATNETRVYVDGTQVGSSNTTLNTYASFFNSTADVWIGGYNADTNDWMDGWIENVRITKGVARYSATFTPPERAYPKRRTSAPVKDGLLLHLDPANPECFGSGETTATNLITGGSLTGASGTPGTGAHTPAPANFPAYSSLNGGIFDFAGGRGMNVEEDLGSYTAMSLEIWYYKDSGATTQYLADARNDGGQWFLTNYTSFNITWQSSATYNFDTTYDGVNTDFINRWQHLIMTSDATGSKLYIDGTERTLLTSNSLSETFGVNYRIGTRYTTSGEWTGYMGPIRLYNRVLSLSEVKQNFNAQKSRFGF